ncbi:MAG: hypothetical protein K0U12_02150, partial [Gammaproteobacteria bacterium]|nr:hypothetical protein [Gammaproteobacteria bacterium]
MGEISTRKHTKVNGKQRSPIYFGAAVWGKDFCQAFMQYCIASLLAEGNIPALPNLNNQNRFLFCTTPEDWEWLQVHPYFILLNRYIKPELMPLEPISEAEYQKLNHPLVYKLYVVTQAHKRLVEKMHQAGSIGSMVFPDTIYANNALKNIYARLLESDKKVVLMYFSRFATPELLDALEAHGYVQKNQPINIANRDLIGYALKHRNLEVLAQGWELLYAFDFINEIWWALSNPDNGVLSHSVAWNPVFINYSKLSSHN